MSVDQPFNIYREQLSSLHHGLALWDPKPVDTQPGHVSIGDVGYLDNGAFMRMFNVTLPWDELSNKLPGKPGEYELINPSYACDVRYNEIREGEHCTPHVSKVDNVGADSHEDYLGQMYQCRAWHRGALLSLPHKGHREDIKTIRAFENHIRDNVNNWFRWSKEMMLPVERMEDLILVTGCTLVTSWAAAAFDSHMSLAVDSELDPTTISLEARKSDGGGTHFFWRNIRGCVEYHNSRFDPNVQESQPQNQCVFIRGFRAKRIFFRTIPMRAAAEPLPDDPDDRLEDEIQVIRIPDSSNYRDPLAGVLDYIVEKCREDVSAAEDNIAIAHDDDLQLIEGVETLTADAVENFLREKNVPLLIENGGVSCNTPMHAGAAKHCYIVPGHFEAPPSPEPPNEPGHLRFGCPRSLYVPPGGTPYRTQAPVWPWVQPGRSVYDMSQQPSVDPSSRSGYIQPYSVQSTNEQYPLGFRPQGSPGPMPGAWPPSQGPADVQDAPESRGSHFTGCTTIASTLGPFTPKWPAAPQEFDLSGQRNWHPQMPDPQPFFGDTGKRRALIIGINYFLHPEPGFKLEKCIEDAYGMANFLRANLGFEHDDVRVITDENRWDLPTADNIREAMAALVYDAQPNDSLLLYFSGHALQVEDMSGQESDGLAECICAMDYHGVPYSNSYTPGLISDDTMHQVMVKPLPPKCRLTAIFDSCHSGGLLGLPHLYDSNGLVKRLRHPERLRILRQKSSYADVVSLSASKDEQEAIETERGGALRWAFIESVRTLGHNLTYKELLCSVRDYMRKHEFPQRPQLSSSYEIDTRRRFTPVKRR